MPHLCLEITSQCRWALNKRHKDTDFLFVKILVFRNVFTIHRWERGFVLNISNKIVDPLPLEHFTARFSLQAGSLVCSDFFNRLHRQNFPRNDTSEHTLQTSTVTVLRDESIERPCRLTPLLEFQLCFDYFCHELAPLAYLYNFIQSVQCTLCFLQFHVRREIPRSYRLLYH